MIFLFKPDDYTQEIAKLAFYPHKSEGNVGALIYCVLGLTGETSETTEKCLDLVNTPLTLEEKQEVTKELGDVLWYSTRTIVELGSSIVEVRKQSTGLGSDVQHDLVTSILGLASVSGKLAEVLKKILRDDDSSFFDPIADSKKDTMLVAMGDVLWWLEQCAFHVCGSLAEVAQANLEKLNSRNRRGVLAGSGDNR